MDPPIEYSVQCLGEDTWLIDRMVVRADTGLSSSSDILAKWRSEDGRAFCIQVADKALLEQAKTIQPWKAEYDAGDAAAVWSFAGVIWKVKAWVPGMQSEAETIAFVKKQFPHVPVPDAVYTWISEATNRSIFVMTRVPGTTLELAWPSLSAERRVALAGQIAELCVDLAQSKRENLETVSSRGITDEWIQDRRPSKPTWKPKVFGPLNKTDAQAHVAPLKVENDFVFMHGDLAACNIMVSKDEKREFTGLIDWEVAGFYPMWWINLKARFGGMFLPPEADSDVRVWQGLLQKELESRNITVDIDAWLELNDKLNKCSI